MIESTFCSCLFVLLFTLSQHFSVVLILKSNRKSFMDICPIIGGKFNCIGVLNNKYHSSVGTKRDKGMIRNDGSMFKF